MTRPLGKIQRIDFSSFRGLGKSSYNIDLNGKNCIVVGGNGKGKSCIADGIEFLFSGGIQRFEDVEPLRNVCSEGSISASVVDMNGNSFKMTIDENNVIDLEPTDRGAFRDYPSVDCFIMRRSKILDFIHSKPSERYASFAKLLGIDRFEEKRKCFEELKAELTAEKKNLDGEYKTKLTVFRQDDGVGYRSLDEVLKYSSVLSNEFGYGVVNSVEDCISVLEKIGSSGNVQEKERYEALLLARQAAGRIKFSLIEEHIVLLNEYWDELEVVARESAEHHLAAIIHEGIVFFGENPESAQCPLCESVVDPLFVLSRLKERKGNLENYNKVKSRFNQILEFIGGWIVSTKNEIGLFLKNSSHVLGLSELVVLGRLQNDLEGIIRNELRNYVDMHQGDLSSLLLMCDRLRVVLENCVSWIDFEIEELKQRVDSKFFTFYAFLFNIKNNYSDILSLEIAIDETASQLKLIDSVRKIFNDAYKDTLCEIVKQFESSVLDIYRYLHGGYADQMECTDVRLEPSKARSWLLELAISFLEKDGLCKPEYYLSEGHLDSLGLSVYLASVLSFNAKGTLVVLDDIVSSVDQEHQQRVADLLVGRFKEYQLLVLTHDERWANLLSSRAIAIGVQGQWKKVQITYWHPENGPMQETFKSNWKYIDENLTQSGYLLLGGVLRKLTESFLKSILAKFQMYVHYKANGSYTIFEILDLSKTNDRNDRCKKINEIRRERGLGPAKQLREVIHGALLLEVKEVVSFSDEDADINMMRAFGCYDLLNELVHDKFYAVQFMEVRDFAVSLRTIEGILQKRGFCA